MNRQDILSYIDANKDRFLEELFDLLRIPSVSADPAFKDDVQRCAVAVKESLLEAGVDVAEIHQTAGHPIVYAERTIDPSSLLCWCMVITTCSLQIRLTYGILLLLSR